MAVMCVARAAEDPLEEEDVPAGRGTCARFRELSCSISVLLEFV